MTDQGTVRERQQTERQSVEQSSGFRSRILVVLAALCLVAGLLPNGERYSQKDTGTIITEWRIGLPFSPLWRYVKREHESGFEFQSGVELLSLSWIPLVAGIGCLRLKKKYSDDARDKQETV